MGKKIVSNFRAQTAWILIWSLTLAMGPGQVTKLFVSLVCSFGNNKSSYLAGLSWGLNENGCCNVCEVLSIEPGTKLVLKLSSLLLWDRWLAVKQKIHRLNRELTTDAMKVYSSLIANASLSTDSLAWTPVCQKSRRHCTQLDEGHLQSLGKYLWPQYNLVYTMVFSFI